MQVDVRFKAEYQRLYDFSCRYSLYAEGYFNLPLTGDKYNREAVRLVLLDDVSDRKKFVEKGTRILKNKNSIIKDIKIAIRDLYARKKLNLQAQATYDEFQKMVANSSFSFDMEDFKL